MNLQVPQNAGSLACFLAGRAKDLSAPPVQGTHFEVNCLSQVTVYRLQNFSCYIYMPTGEDM